MKRVAYVLFAIALLSPLTFAAIIENELGVGVYPNATEMPEATGRLLERKGPSWIAARVYRTDDSIKDVVKYFRQQAEKAKKPAGENDLVNRLLADNWKLIDGTVRSSNELFGASKDLRAVSKEKTKTGFGTILLDDSFVQVHLISPYPTSPTTVTVTDGTMIVLIREKMPDATASSADEDVQETVYTGREVTRKVRIRSKPEPVHVGRTGTVVLKAVFGSSGKVTRIVVVSGVPGLTELAIDAARRITFDPAIKDGRYVAMWLQLEYNFF